MFPTSSIPGAVAAATAFTLAEAAIAELLAPVAHVTTPERFRELVVHMAAQPQTFEHLTEFARELFLSPSPDGAGRQ